MISKMFYLIVVMYGNGVVRYAKYMLVTGSYILISIFNN